MITLKSQSTKILVDENKSTKLQSVISRSSVGEPIAHFKCNDDTASTVFTDSIGTYTGASIRNSDDMNVTGKINSGVHFNGIPGESVKAHYTFNGDVEDKWAGNFDGSLTTPTILNECDVTTNFSSVQNCTFSVNNTTFQETAAINTYRASGANTTNLGFDVEFTQQDLTGKILSIYLYIKDQTTLDKLNLNDCKMYIRGGDWNGYRFKTHEDGNVDDPIVGWNVLTLDMDNPDFIEGGADLTVANTLRIRLYHDDLDETFTEGDIIMDYLVYDTPMKAKNKAGVDNKAYQFSSEMAVTIPVGHWKMNGDSTDSIGSFDGTDTNITYPSGKLNQSASFASDTSHIDVAADEDLNLKNEMSVSMWYKATNTPSGGSYRYLFRNDGGTWDASIKFFVIHETSGEISWSIVPEGAGDSNDYYRLFTSGDALTPGTWYHITCTYNNVTGVMNIYINSAIVATSTETPADIIDLNIPIIIGGDGGGTQNVLGEMDDVRIYDEALTQPEINKIYNGDTGTETSKIYTGAKTYVTTNATPDELGIGVGRSYSYSVWVYPTGISNVSRNQYSYIVTKRGWHCGLLFNTDSSFKMTMETASHTGSASAGGTTGKSLNQWYHVVGTYNKDNQEVKIYVDGELEGTDTGSGEEYNSTNDVLIGRSSTSLGDWAYPFGGKIDDVRIYSRYLKADDVKGLYNSGVVNYEENDYIDFGTILVDSNNQSISFWYKTTDDRFQMLFQHELSSSNSNIEFEPNGNTLRVESKTNNFWDKTFSTGIDIDDGEWHNYIFTFGSDSRLYVDGILADTETENTDSEQFEYRYIGGYGTHNFSYGHTPKGDFDDIRIYDRQLGYDEVQSLYNLNAGNEGTVYTVNRIGLESQPTIELNTYRCSQIPLEAE